MGVTLEARLYDRPIPRPKNLVNYKVMNKVRKTQHFVVRKII
jgi:hypothetical protein